MAGAGRPAWRRAAESQVTDDASRGQPKRRPEAEPLPLPVTEPVMGLAGKVDTLLFIFNDVELVKTGLHMIYSF